MLNHETAYVKKVCNDMKDWVADWNSWNRPKLDTLHESLAFNMVLAACRSQDRCSILPILRPERDCKPKWLRKHWEAMENHEACPVQLNLFATRHVINGFFFHWLTGGPHKSEEVQCTKAVLHSSKDSPCLGLTCC